MEIKNLKIGQSLLTLGTHGSPVVTTFPGWLHRDAGQEASFLQITTQDGYRITLTPTHILMVGSSMKLASQVMLGDLLISKSGTATPVTAISEIVGTGVYSPLTLTSTIIVDGLLASCFAGSDCEIAPDMVSTFHRQAHLCFGPVRAFPWLLDDFASQQKVNTYWV